MAGNASTIERLKQIRPVDIAQITALAALLARAELLLRTRPIAEAAAAHHVGFLRTPGDVDPDVAPNLHYSPTEWRWIKNQRRLLKRWPWDKSCLRRSLLLGWILRDRDPDLMIGARADEDGEIRAHAWIRLGRLDLDIESQNYLTF